MNVATPTELKSILHSKRANIYYLEHCRILVNGGRVEYVTDQGKRSLYWNIPIANTTTVLLGTGTSVTQAAVRELAKAGVLLGFCGGGGTPLFAGAEPELAIWWAQPQSEYRPTEYLQRWASFWFDDSRRLLAAKAFQRARLERIRSQWCDRGRLRDSSFDMPVEWIDVLLSKSLIEIGACASSTDLLTTEARLTKQLYKLAAQTTKYGDFSRGKHGDATDAANRFLDHGNYLAYGLGATAVWVLGIPHAFPLLHGKTRRGGLVFDVADLVKDAHILPQAFIAAVRGYSEEDFRQACVQSLTRAEALDFMIDTIKLVSAEFGALPPPVVAS